MEHTGAVYPRVVGRDVNLNTHLSTALKLRITGATLLFPLYTFMVCRGAYLVDIEGDIKGLS